MKMFKPYIDLVVDKGGQTYTMYASIWVPSGCYMSLGAELGVPEDVAVIAEVEAVTLRVTHTKIFCTQAIKLLDFVVRNIPISQGKTDLMAFTYLDGTTVASAAKRIPGGGAIPGPEVETSEKIDDGVSLLSFSAWINAMPGGDPTLIATAVLAPPPANAHYQLEKRGPYGFSERTLLFELKKAPTSTTGMIRYEETAELGVFDTAAVLFGDQIYFDELDIAS